MGSVCKWAETVVRYQNNQTSVHPDDLSAGTYIHYIMHAYTYLCTCVWYIPMYMCVVYIIMWNHVYDHIIGISHTSPSLSPGIFPFHLECLPFPPPPPSLRYPLSILLPPCVSCINIIRSTWSTRVHTPDLGRHTVCVHHGFCNYFLLPSF